MSNLGKVNDSTLFDWKLDEMPKWQAVPLRLYKAILTSEKLCCWVIILCCAPSVIVFLHAMLVPNMANDGIVTMEEQWILILENQQKCTKEQTNKTSFTDSHGIVHQKFCRGEFDSITCWPDAAPSSSVNVQCPSYIADFDPDGFAERYCEPSGEWKMTATPNKTWANYNRCRFPNNEQIILWQATQGKDTVRTLIQMYNVGYSFSLVALILAMSILVYFKRLHCTRNYIHMHLFVSFIFRAVIIFTKDALLYKGSGVLDVMNNDFFLTGDTHTPSERVGCKLVVTMFHYFMATNYFWVLVEGLYLHSLIFVTFFSDKKYLWRFILTGWGLPLCFVIPWAIVRSMKHDSGCWDIGVPEYRWIYNGPIIVANIINFMLFINIVRVLWYKMRRGMCGQPDISRQYKKLAKSTLVLIPMFGAHVVIFLGLPDSVADGTTLWKVRMYWDLFFNSFQGFFVAIIYCFTNGEVQAEFKRAWDRFYTSFEIQRGQRERSRSSVTMLANFSSVSQVRNSIGSQHNVNHRGTSVEVGDVKQSLVHGSLPADANDHQESNKSLGNTNFLIKKETKAKSGARRNSDKSINSNKQISPNKPIVGTTACVRKNSDKIIDSCSNIIIPLNKIEHDVEEKEFEKAIEENLEDQIKCPADSFDICNASDDLPPSDPLDGYDQDIVKCRAPSDDSGIDSSVTSSMNRRSRVFLDNGNACDISQQLDSEVDC